MPGDTYSVSPGRLLCNYILLTVLVLALLLGGDFLGGAPTLFSSISILWELPVWVTLGLSHSEVLAEYLFASREAAEFE